MLQEAKKKEKHPPNRYVLLWSISSFFEYSLSPLLGANPERRQSEPRAKAEWRQPPVIIIPKRTKIRVPLLRKKKWHYVAPNDNDNNNNNNNNNRDETTLPSQFTPQFTVHKANTMTDNYIRLTMTYELQ